MLRSLLCFLLLSALLFPFAFQARAVEPPEDKETAKKVKALIDQLAEISDPGMGYSSSVSGDQFLPLDAHGNIHTMMLFQEPLVSSEALRELVKLGVRAVPQLIEHLDDQRATRIAPVDATFGIGGYCDFNRRSQKQADGPGPMSEPEVEVGQQSYTIRVGDLCFVALGQIVNREFTVVHYIPSGIVSVNSPTRFAKLRAAVKEQWHGLTGEKHKAALLADLNKPDKQSRLVGAAKRLAFYYPDALEEPAKNLLTLPTFNGEDVDRFVHEELYPAKDSAKRKKLFQDFLAKYGNAAREGILSRLFDDLEQLEAYEKEGQAPDQGGIVKSCGCPAALGGGLFHPINKPYPGDDLWEQR